MEIEEIKKIFETIIRLIGKEKYEELKVNKKLELIIDNVDNIIKKEPDEYKRGCLWEFFLDKYSIEVLGRNDIDEEKIENEFKNKYGMVITNETRQRLNYLTRILEEEINSFISPEHKIILSKNSEILLSINELKREIQSYYNLCKISNCSVNDNKKINDDYDRYIKLWESSLFMEEQNEKRLADVFVETNFRVINISKKNVNSIRNDKQRNKFLMEKKHNEEYLIQYLNDYTEEDMPERALRRYESDNKIYSNLNEILNIYINSEKKISLILGLPGSGKSSLVSYLAGKYFDYNKKNIFVSLSKLKNANSLLEAVCAYLNVKQEDLENKFLVLDGLDEINYTNNAESLLINFINDIKNLYDNIKVFITVRENYINIEDLKYISYYAQCYIIQIGRFGLMQMIDFHHKYTKENITLKRLQILNQEKQVLGIPLLLYIVYSLDIDLSNEQDKYRLYKKIFSIQNGIYDKCNAGYGGYDILGKKFTVEDKESFHSIAQEIAHEMFLKNTLMIRQADIECRIQEGQYTETSIKCYLYNNFYERIDEKIGFIHKSFYEYFLAEYIGNRLNEIYFDNSLKEEKYKLMCDFFSIRKIEEEVYQHLLIKLEDDVYISTVNYNSFLAECIVFAMKYGGDYSKMEKVGVLRTQAIMFFNIFKLCTVIRKITNCEIELESENFYNICGEISNIEQQGYLQPRLLDGVFFRNTIYEYAPLKVLGVKRDNANLINIRNKIMTGTTITYMNFTNSKLRGIYFLFSMIANCRFEWADLRDCDFRECTIDKTQFINSSFENTNFQYSIFVNVNFRGTNLDGTEFSNAILDKVEFDEDNVWVLDDDSIEKSHIHVYMKKTRKSITYEEYLTIISKE